MLRWTTALSIALATSAAALPAHAQVWVPAWTASPAPDRQDGTPEAPVQFAHQTVRQDMRLGTSASTPPMVRRMWRMMLSRAVFL